MSTVLQPRATSGNVIGCALALSLDEDREVGGGAIPDLEGLEKLETVALGVNSAADAGTVCRRRLEGVLARVIATRWEFVTGRSLELEGLAIGADQGVSQGVETEYSGERQSSGDVRGCDEGMGGGVSIVTAGEVTVVRSDDWLASQKKKVTRKKTDDDALVFFSPFLTSCLSHWPMQGPQALARTMAPAPSKSSI